MKEAFRLEEALAFGTVPLVLDDTDRRERLEAYVETYLKEEIQAEALVRNLPGLARFLPVASLFHGQVLSVESLARDCEVKPTTVIGFIDILVDTLLAAVLPPLEERLRVKQRKHPKLYWLDPGVARAASKRFGPLAQEERGAMFEGLVFQ